MDEMGLRIFIVSGYYKSKPMNITGLTFNSQIFEENFIAERENILDYEKIFFEGSMIIMRGIPNRYLEGLLIGSALKKDETSIQALLDGYIESSVLKYYLFNNLGKECEFSYKGKELTGIPEKYASYVNEIDWTNAFMACLLNRDMKSAHKLCEYNLDVIGKPKEGVSGGNHSLVFAKFLQQLFQKGVNHGKNLLDATNAINKDNMPDSTYNHALYIYGPVIDMFANILYPNETEFNKMLLSALENHVKYHSKDDLVYPYSTTSLWISAVTAMAKDYEIKIEHTSDILINQLI